MNIIAIAVLFWLNLLLTTPHVQHQSDEAFYSSANIFLDVEAVLSCNRQSDSLVLVKLYEVTDGGNWTNPWDLTRPMNTWQGVFLDANGCVRILGLGSRKLDGVIPDEIGDLSALEELYLDKNSLYGSIPESIGKLSQLKKISLAFNSLTGILPESMGNLTNLEIATLGSNPYTPSVIPSALLNLPKLTLLYIDKSLIDSLPPFSPNPNLDLNVPGNHFTFDDILNGTSQRMVNFSYFNQAKIYKDTVVNARQGETVFIDLGIDKGVSNSYYAWQKNGQWYRDEYQPTFTITNIQPEDAGSYFVKISNDDAPSVNLSSYPILINVEAVVQDPTQTCRYKDSLILVEFYNNTNGPNWITQWNFTRPMNTWFGVTLNQQGCVQFLDLTGNNLSGFIPPSITTLPELERFNIVGNTFEGAIPDYLGNFIKLKTLRLSLNRFSGQIPNSLGNLKDLDYLEIDNCRLTGTIPESFGNFVKITMLELDRNQLSGAIPTSLENLVALKSLYLFGNQFSGTLPAGLANLPNLQIVEVQDNQLIGAVPSFTQNLIGLRLENNRFTSLPDLSNINTWARENWRGLQVQSNILTFKDLLPNKNIFDTNPPSKYAPQDSIGTLIVYTLEQGNNLTHDLDIDNGVTSNVYNWYKDNPDNNYLTKIGDNTITWENVTTNEAGNYYVRITNPNLPNLTLYGRRVQLIVKEKKAECTPDVQNFTKKLCPDGNYNFAGEILTQAGNYTKKFQNKLGCDSTVNINIQILPSYQLEQTKLVCAPEEVGITPLFLTTKDGCDSIINVKKVYQPSSLTILGRENVTTCDPAKVGIDTIPIKDNNGNCEGVLIKTTTLGTANSPTTLTEMVCRANLAGSETLTFPKSDGCDSIVVINKIYEPLGVSRTASICGGQSYNFYGRNLTSAGTYETTVTGVCDTFVRLTLTLGNPVQENVERQFCEGETFEFGTLRIRQSGIYTQRFTSSGGCDSLVTLILEEAKKEFIEIKNDTITTLSNRSNLELDVLSNDVLPNEANRRIAIIEQPKLGTVNIAGEKLSYQLQNTGNTGVDQFRYQVCALDCVNNCDTAMVVIQITTTCLDSLMKNIPTAFIPNSDEPMDNIFDPLAGISNECFQQPSNAEFMIVNAWGELVYRSKPYRAWDGRNSNDKPLPQGTYYYVLKFETDDEKSEVIKGWVTLFGQ